MELLQKKVSKSGCGLGFFFNADPIVLEINRHQSRHPQKLYVLTLKNLLNSQARDILTVGNYFSVASKSIFRLQSDHELP